MNALALNGICMLYTGLLALKRLRVWFCSGWIRQILGILRGFPSQRYYDDSWHLPCNTPT